VASQLSPENRPPVLCLHGIPYFLEPCIHLSALDTEFLPTGLSKEDELTLSIHAAVMGEPKEVKGIGSAILFACSFSFKSTKADYTSLLRM
jgi:hypothetical protein